MMDLEWASAFVRCKIENTGYRFADTVKVFVKKLGEVRAEGDLLKRSDDMASPIRNEDHQKY